MYPSVAVANRALVNARARSNGHAITVVITDMNVDWLDCHASCKCGWRSRDMSSRSAARAQGVAHMEEKS